MDNSQYFMKCGLW